MKSLILIALLFSTAAFGQYLPSEQYMSLEEQAIFLDQDVFEDIKSNTSFDQIMLVDAMPYGPEDVGEILDFFSDSEVFGSAALSQESSQKIMACVQRPTCELFMLEVNKLEGTVAKELIYLVQLETSVKTFKYDFFITDEYEVDPNDL